MTEAERIYKDNIGNTHEAALKEVWKAAFEAGIASVQNNSIPNVKKS